MELTVDQALQQGIAAHKEGKLQDAERLYRAILQAQPNHPDANHNLGVLAVAVDKPLEAIPLFKLALEANPQIEQFWLSHIDALITVERFDEAKHVLVEGKKSGVSSEKLDALNQRLQASVTIDTNKTEKGQTLLEKRKKLAEKKKSKKRKTQGHPSTAAPSQDQINHLLEHYQAGRLEKTETLATSLTQQFPKHSFGWKVLGAVFKQTGRLVESLEPMQSALKLSPQDAVTHSNLGAMLKELGRLDEAEASYRQAIALKPDYAEAHYNLGNTLKKLGRLDEAEASYRQATALKPDFAEAHTNLANTFKEHGKLDEAEACYRQAIALKPHYAEAHNNLGNTLKELGRLDEAEASYRQAIALKPDYAEAHNNLGNTLKEISRLDEAEASYKRAIALQSDLALAHYGLGTVHYMKGNEELALKNIVKANSIEPQSKDIELMLTIMEAKRSRKENGTAVVDANSIKDLTGLFPSPIIFNRTVEPELITSLYEMNSIQLDNAKRAGSLPSGKIDARYGNGRVSPDFNLFKNGGPSVQKLAEDLTEIMMGALKSNIYIYDSFFNILGPGGGTIPHNHLTDVDKNSAVDIGKQKYSLVYYLSVGDQRCEQPGILKLYEPDEDILPCDGTILVIPASRMHSALYGGKTDRVMIGVNFYSL